MGNTVDIGLWSMLVCYLMAAGMVALFSRLKLELTRDLIISLARMTLQLVAASLVLKYLFRLNNMGVVLLLFLAMSGFSANIILKRSKTSHFGIFPKLMLVVFSVGLTITLVFMVAIARFDPWYDARFFIPLGGMILGNSMNGCALALDRFFSAVKDDRKGAETLLALGATPFEVSLRYIRGAIRNAALPFVTNMSGMGIVFIPGLMTGQLLSGTPPLIAVKYQIAIMICIACSVVFTSLLTLLLSYPSLFNRKHMLQLPE
jgi:putative ABC transport system permease protein